MTKRIYDEGPIELTHIYSTAHYWVCERTSRRGDHWHEVYKQGPTHSVIARIIKLGGSEGLAAAVACCDELEEREKQPTLEALLTGACELGFPVLARERDGRWKAEFAGLAFHTEVRRNTPAEALSDAIAKAREAGK